MKGKIFKKVLAVATSVLMLTGGVSDRPFAGIFKDMAITASAEGVITEISTAEQWNAFATSVNNGTTYEGKTVKLTADISSITTIAGTSDHKFKGKFLGNGKTLTVALSSGSQGCAPFGYVEGATINCLHVTGTVTLSATNAFHASGLVGFSEGVTINNCHVSVAINFPSGTGTVHSGGIIGHAKSAPFTMTNCLFDGSFGYTSGSGTMTNVGGLVGWDDASTPIITNCLNAGTFSNPSVISKIARVDGRGTIDNCYSTINATSDGSLNDNRGTYTTATGESLRALLGSSWEVSGGKVVPIMSTTNIGSAAVSGIKQYYMYTGNVIAIDYTVTAVDGTTLTKGRHFTETFSSATVKDMGDYTLTISGMDGYTGSQTFHFTVGDYIAVTNTTTVMSNCQYKVQQDVTISDRIVVNGDVTLTLEEGCTLTAQHGIEVEALNTLTIDGAGSLTIPTVSDHSFDYCAGIGGNDGKECGHIIINGGIITIQGGYRAAGIGGGRSSAGGTITINGGTVTANGGFSGAGIGGGSDGAGGVITITGGEVTANGGRNGAGIGGGEHGAGGNISVSGGTVTANGGKYGAGIGGGAYKGAGGEITISDGKVEATGGENGAGIGGGNQANGGEITITGGNIEAKGGISGAGIGGGDQANGGEITISGGTVETTGGNYGAGIGCGSDGAGGTITINGGTVTAKGGISGAGIGGAGSEITISGGNVEATGGHYGAGIGGGDVGTSGNITITDGEVTANGGQYGAGIGGGSEGAGGVITITGGEVTANGGRNGAGIGGGLYGAGGEITISGGKIKAYGGESGAGIGGGTSEESTITGGTITISDGKVEATGGENGAGIGGGFNGAGGTITINGGKVTANGGNVGAGIGGGRSAAGGVITINGGEVTANGGYGGAGIGGGLSGAGGVITINGGTVKADDINSYTGIGGGLIGAGGTIELGWINATDSISAKSYSGTVTIAAGKKFTDGTTTYDSNTTSETLSALSGVTLTPANAHSITVASTNNGTVTTNANEKEFEGETVTLTVTPDEGYAVKIVSVNDGDVAVTDNQNGTYSFTMPAEDVTVSAEFIKYTLVPAKAATCEEDGNIEYYAGSDGGLYVRNGDSFTETTPEAVTIPKITHTYGEPVWTWDGYAAASAAFTCGGCGDVQTADAAINSQRTEPTDDADGSIVYTASVTFNGQEYTDVKTEILYQNGTADISGFRLIANPTSFAYDGEAHTVNIRLKRDDGTYLTEGVDYTVSGNTAIEKGTYTLTVKGIGAYCGTVYAVWKIGETFCVTADTGNGIVRTTYDEKASANVRAANIEGKKFKCWMSDGKILSYSKSYSFIVLRDIELEAVYVDESETVEPEPVLDITAIRTTYNGMDAIGLELIHSVPTELQVTEIGIQYATNRGLGYTTGDDYAKVNLLEDPNYNVPELLKTQTNHIAAYQYNNGRYVFSVAVGNHTDCYVYGIGYVKYLEDGVEKIKYCDAVVAVTFNTAE